MPTVMKLMSIAIIALSVIIGLIVFYLLSHESEAQKRTHIEEIFSQVINFIIFIWVGKIVLHLPLFVTDPLAILAYPSNSEAFYLAVLGSTLVLLYKSKRKKMDVLAFIDAFSIFFLAASLTYAFIQFTWEGDTYSFGYIVLAVMLLIFLLIVKERLATKTRVMILVTGWTLGMFLLNVVQPFTTVFGYIIAPWFAVLLFIVSWIIMIWKQRKRDSYGRN